jgi:hypothetical protein
MANGSRRTHRRQMADNGQELDVVGQKRGPYRGVGPGGRSWRHRLRGGSHLDSVATGPGDVLGLEGQVVAKSGVF